VQAVKDGGEVRSYAITAARSVTKRDCPMLINYSINNGGQPAQPEALLEQRRINSRRTRSSKTVESLVGSRRLNESTYVQELTVGREVGHCVGQRK